MDKFDLERLEKYKILVGNSYKREINGSNPSLKGFMARYCGDVASFNANEIKLFKIKPEMNAILKEYQNLFN